MKRLVLPPLGKTIKSWRHLENRPPALVVGLAIPVISDCLWKHHQTVRQCVCLFFSVDGGVELRMNSLKTIPQQRQRGREWMETNNKICSHNSKIPLNLTVYGGWTNLPNCCQVTLILINFNLSQIEYSNRSNRFSKLSFEPRHPRSHISSNICTLRLSMLSMFYATFPKNL